MTWEQYSNGRGRNPVSGPGTTAEREQIAELLTEFRSYKSYCTQRLTIVRQGDPTDWKLEREEEDLQKYADFMDDEDEDLFPHGLDQIKGYIERMQDLARINPIQSEPNDCLRRSPDGNDGDVRDEDHPRDSSPGVSGSFNVAPAASRGDSPNSADHYGRGAEIDFTDARPQAPVGAFRYGHPSPRMTPGAPVPRLGPGSMAFQAPISPPIMGGPHSPYPYSSQSSNISQPHVRRPPTNIMMTPGQVLDSIPPNIQQFIWDLPLSPGDVVQLDSIARMNGWTFPFVLHQLVREQCSPQEGMTYCALLKLLLQGKLSLPGVMVCNPAYSQAQQMGFNW